MGVVWAYYTSWQEMPGEGEQCLDKNSKKMEEEGNKSLTE